MSPAQHAIRRRRILLDVMHDRTGDLIDRLLDRTANDSDDVQEIFDQAQRLRGRHSPFEANLLRYELGGKSDPEETK